MKTAIETATATKWVLDPSHSEINFKVRHLMISNVKGEFRKFTAQVNGEDFTASTIEAEIDATSIFTNDDKRDEHLKSGDFFDVVQHPSISFTGKSFKKLDESNYTLAGALVIKGISKDVSLDVEFGGLNTDPWGNKKAAFSISGKINRKDWGLTWNATLETGGVLVSDEIRINAELQFIKQS